MTKTPFKSPNNEFVFAKYLSILVAIFTVSFILPSILLRDSVSLPVFGVIPISILFTGTYFVILDVITEVYGYQEAKKAIYAALICYTAFVFIMEFVINIHTDATTSTKSIANHAYDIIFSNIYQTWFSVVICTLIFDIFNIRLLSKLKFLLKGKYFILRSIGSSSISIILFSVVTCFFAFLHEIMAGNFKFYFTVIGVSITAKIVSLIVLSAPAAFLCKFLKKSENLDITFKSNLFLFNKESQT